jgi:hypothetical protein
MGMSMTAEQGKTLDRLQVAERNQVGWFSPNNEQDVLQPGTFFFESPTNGRDYGTESRPNMPVEIMVMVENGFARPAGYVHIAPDGQFKMPARVRKALKV